MLISSHVQVQAFSVSVKAGVSYYRILNNSELYLQHLLRGEQGIYYEDLYPLVSFLPRYANNPVGDLPDEDERLPLFEPPDGYKTFHENPVIIPEVEPKVYDKESPVVNGGSDTPATRVSLRRQDTFNPEALLPQIESEYPLRPARNPPTVTMYDYFPLLKIFPWLLRLIKVLTRRADATTAIPRRRKAYSELVESHVPLEILLVLSK